MRARLVEDPHLWALTLFDELQPLGFGLSYPTLRREIWAGRLRPDCLACRGATGRANAVIDHPPGEETQWDWLDLPDPPAGWGWVSRALGGATKAWRFDRMTTICHPDTGEVTASFAGVAKHYGVSVSICPPRSGHRKGVGLRD